MSGSGEVFFGAVEGEKFVRVRWWKMEGQTEAPQVAQDQHHHVSQASAVSMLVGQFAPFPQEVAEV